MKNFTDWQNGELVPTWQGFRPNRQTVLQTHSTDADQLWHMAYIDDGEAPAYWISITKDPKCILEVLVHLSEKTWVDPGKLLAGMLPAIEAVRFGR